MDLNIVRNVYKSHQEKLIDFGIGIFGWLVGNIFLGILFFYSGRLINWMLPESILTAPEFQVLAGLVNFCMPIILNIGALVYYAKSRYWISIGAFSFLVFFLFIGVVAVLITTTSMLILLANSF